MRGEPRSGSRVPRLPQRAEGHEKPRAPKAAPLARYFPMAPVDEDSIMRTDGASIAVLETRGMEVDQPLLLAFASALNALDFPVQLLVRQHPPDLRRLRETMAQASPEGMPPPLDEAATSLNRLLGEMEHQHGVLDRRFYTLCHLERASELRGILERTGLSIFPVTGPALRSLVEGVLLGRTPGSGQTPAQPARLGQGTETATLHVAVGSRLIELDDQVIRSFQMKRWPRSLPPGFLQRLLALGLPMEVALHVAPIPIAQAARTLEWQKVKMESANAVSLRRGRSPSPEAGIGLEDVERLREELHRGRERLFHASLVLTVHADSLDALKAREQLLRGHFAGVMASLDGLPFRQRDGHLSALPLALNATGAWRIADTTSLAYLFPFAPPDLDTRRGTLFGLDLRGGSPVVFDAFDSVFLNANTAVLARSGAGKSFSTKLGLLRGVSRGIAYYVIDPEGEYTGLAEALGGRVLTPGSPGHGLNPFVVDGGDEGEFLQRIGGLRRLVEVMVGERFHPEQRAVLDHALTAYYTGRRGGTGFQDFYRFLSANGAHPDPEGQVGRNGFEQMAALLRPFATGSLRHLLSDDGTDLLGHEASVTVFSLRLLEPELRPAATLVCAEAVWAMAARDPKPRVLVVDEVWSIMQHAEGASFLVSLAKRARKHQLGLISVTQDVQDFLAEDASRPIAGHSGRVLLQNSSFKLLLQQDAAALRAVQESFDLSSADAQWLLSCPRGDGLLIARGGKFPVRIVATPEEQQIIDHHGERMKGETGGYGHHCSVERSRTPSRTRGGRR